MAAQLFNTGQRTLQFSVSAELCLVVTEQFEVYSSLCTVQLSVQCTVQCTLYTIHCTLYTVHVQWQYVRLC